MAIFGWIVLVIITIGLSAFYGLVAMNGLGRYNVGGVPNRPKKKILIGFLGLILILWWVQVVYWAPFSVVMK